MLKKFVVFILIFSGAAVFIYRGQINDQVNKVLYKTFCDTPVTYKIGVVDPKFGISKAKFQDEVTSSAAIWNKVIDKDVFKFDPEGAVTVNLIFDERQALNNKINQLENKVNSGKSTLNTSYAQYQALVKDFQSKLDNINNEIKYWNARGGAPPDEFQKIQDEQKALQAEADQINAMANTLNLSTSSYNSQVNQLNQTIDNFNKQLELKPEEGLYVPENLEIDIYFDVTEKELVHTLAHELGHARGMEHETARDSIMYPYTTEVTKPSAEDVTQIQAICSQVDINKNLNDAIKELLSSLKFSTPSVPLKG